MVSHTAPSCAVSVYVDAAAARSSISTGPSRTCIRRCAAKRSSCSAKRCCAAPCGVGTARRCAGTGAAAEGRRRPGRHSRDSRAASDGAAARPALGSRQADREFLGVPSSAGIISRIARTARERRWEVIFLTTRPSTRRPRSAAVTAVARSTWLPISERVRRPAFTRQDCRRPAARCVRRRSPGEVPGHRRRIEGR